MLPPVSSVLSASTTYQKPSSQTVSSAEIALAAVAATIADTGVESTADARFGILKLSGSGTIANTLVELAEQLGKAINLPRREGEVGTDYLLRLAQTIKTLAPEDQARISQQLNQIVQGVKVRLLTEALTNPAGPEAAKLIAVLEMASSKDRDLAARAVVSSYRQNAGAETPLAERAAAVPLAAKAAVATAAPTQSAQPGSQTSAAAILSALAGLATMADPEEPVTALPAATLPATKTDGGANGVKTALAARELPGAAANTQFSELDDLADAAARETSPARSAPATSDIATGARAVQGQLQQRLDGQATGVPARSIPEHDSAVPLAKGALPIQVRASDSILAGGQPVLAGPVDGGDLPLSRQAMLAFTEWAGTETDTLLPRPALQGPVTLPALPQTGLHPGHSAEAATVQTTAYQPLPFAEHDEFTQRHQGKPDHTDPSAVGQDRSSQDNSQARADAAAIARTPAMMEQQMAQLRSTVIRDGQPLPYIPYPIIDEFDDSSGTATDLHRGHGEEEGEAEEDAQAEDEQDDAATAAEISDEPAEPSGSDDADPAYDLYRRMAGWG
jgi:hypothetical protein